MLMDFLCCNSNEANDSTVFLITEQAKPVYNVYRSCPVWWCIICHITNGRFKRNRKISTPQRFGFEPIGLMAEKGHQWQPVCCFRMRPLGGKCKFWIGQQVEDYKHVVFIASLKVVAIPHRVDPQWSIT